MCQFVGKRPENTVAKRVASTPNVTHLDVTVHATTTAATTTTKNGIRLCWVSPYLILPTYLILQFSRWSGQANSIATWTARHGRFCLFYFYCLFFCLFYFFSPSTKKRNPGVKLSFGTLNKTCPSAHFTRLVLRQTISQDLSFGTLYKTCPSADYFSRLVLTVADWNQGRCVSSKSDGPAPSCWGFGEIPSDFRRP